MIYSPKILSRIVNCLAEGGVIIFPTETVMALACDATNAEAVQKIYHLKKRDSKKPLAVLMADVFQALDYVEISSKWLKLINQYSPGPVSYVLPVKATSDICPEILHNGTLSIRIPDHQIAAEILASYQHPLVGTSVNLAGENSALIEKDIPQNIRDNVDLVVGGDKPAYGIASTVLDLSMDSPRIIRQGAVLL